MSVSITDLEFLSVDVDLALVLNPTPCRGNLSTGVSRRGRHNDDGIPVEHSPGPWQARFRVIFLARPRDATPPKSQPDEALARGALGHAGGARGLAAARPRRGALLRRRARRSAGLPAVAARGRGGAAPRRAAARGGSPRAVAVVLAARLRRVYSFSFILVARHEAEPLVEAVRAQPRLVRGELHPEAPRRRASSMAHRIIASPIPRPRRLGSTMTFSICATTCSRGSPRTG